MWRKIIQAFAKPHKGFGSPEGKDAIVYGARRPGFPFNPVPDEVVTQWLDFMRTQAIQRVVCLLPPSQLSGYNDLIGKYSAAFGSLNVCWAPIEDFTLATESMLL
jgi:hypothetical protein